MSKPAMWDLRDIFCKGLPSSVGCNDWAIFIPNDRFTSLLGKPGMEVIVPQYIATSQQDKSSGTSRALGYV